MNDTDLKVGVEIHQQLDTKKLFCNCPSILTDKNPDFIVKRRLNAVAGETGKVDIAAEYEAIKKKEYLYEGYNDRTCEIELDESPPRKLNLEALRIVLQVAILLNARILKATQIMRKTVIDGSNTSGFQRTILIARDGYVETKEGKIKVDSICLEEDSARRIKSDSKSVTFRLDRLGIPLIEIATSPDIKSSEQTKEVASKIGEILRACQVKRGIGTIRQDINVNIKGHPRIEIKGFQDLRTMPKTIEFEIERQKKEPSKSGEVRKANPDSTTSFLRPLPGGARMYPETDLPILKITKEMIDEAKRNLPRLRSELKEDLKKYGLNEEIINQLIKQNQIQLFEELVKVYNNPKLIARTLTNVIPSIKTRQNANIEAISDKILIGIFKKLKENNILENNIESILLKICEGKSIEEAIQKEDTLSSPDIESEIKNIIREKPNLSIGAYMGLLMQKFKGKIDGKILMEILKKYVK